MAHSVSPYPDPAAAPDGAARFALPVIDPDTGAVAMALIEDDAEAVDRAVLAAAAAFRSGIWSGTALADRAAVLRRAAGLIRAEARALAELDCRTTGLLLHRSLIRQAEVAAGWFDYFAGLIMAEGDAHYPQTDGALVFSRREPAGVAALFTPWNIPLAGAALKLAAALACGNSCVLKPSEQSPLGARRLVELLAAAGVPDGVVQLVNGRGTVTGAALAAHPDVALVSFTGGEAAGRAVAGLAAQHFARTTLELGGKSATILCADCDFGRALDGALQAAFGNSGQACLAGSRILVARPLFERLVDAFVARTRALRIGRPTDPTAEMGPLATESAMHRVLDMAGVARAEGGTIATGGARIEGFGGGWYVAPTVVLPCSNADRICQEEAFGPIVAILPFDDSDEAVALANATRFGLAGYVWSESGAGALRIAERLRAGTVLVNSVMRREQNAPFGGFGASGIDREGGRWSLDFYSEAKTMVIGTSAAPIPKLGAA